MSNIANSPEFVAFSKRCRRMFAPGHWYHHHTRDMPSRFVVTRTVTRAQHDPTHQYTDAFWRAGMQVVDYDRLLFDVIAPAFAQRRR
jgi:hypothetical protein